MKFECQQCHQRLSAPAAAAGKVVRCPSCNARIQVPAPAEEPAPAEDRKGAAGPRPKAKERRAWKEADPTNPHFLKSLGIGIGLLLLWYGLLLPFNPPGSKPIADYSTMQYVASLFFKHLAASVLNTLFFSWAMAIIFLKLKIIRHQRAALLLDVLPAQLGKEIDAQNVGAFLDHVYALPVSLRDSLMVNRIRKALELFEIRQSAGDVREMMVSQSEIDSARIGGSYSLLRAFLWGIPLVGFIGTVVGLSHAIGGMSFNNVEDITKIISSINTVTSGLGTAFDATLLGLVLALTLNFPLNALAKQEDDNLHAIDAFCNEVLLPRLKESAAFSGLSDAAGVAEAIVRAVGQTQEKFLTDLNELSRRMNEYTGNMDRRLEAFTQVVTEEFVTKTEAQRAQTDQAVKEALEKATRTLSALETGIGSLNLALQKLGEKQVTVQAPRRWFWFGRG